MDKLEIHIQTRKMLKPSTPTVNHLQSLKLSLFDQLAPRHYEPVLFHYLPSTSDCEEGIIMTERCDKLQKSLAQTLTKYYPLAGRFREDELSIHCNDEGVEYVETKVNADLAKFIHQGVPKNIELLNDLLPEMEHVPSSPLLGVQVNVFNCGGVVIAIQMSHILADGFTFATFVKEWAHISQTGTTEDCLPRFGQLPLLFPTRVLSRTRFSRPPNHGPKIVTRRFVFDALAITKLKNTIDSSATFRKPTRVVVVMSLIWKVLADISSAKNGHSRDSSLIFYISLRGKFHSPSLKNALGNCTTFGIADLEASQSRNELTDFVNLVGNTIQDTSVGIGKASVDDVSSLVLNNQSKVAYKRRQGDTMDIYRCTSWCRFPLYEADFGWGKPFWVSAVSFDIIEIVCLMDTKNGDGIEAWVSLKENVMAEFEKHPDILTVCPPLPS
ncbi:putative acetyl-CoA-benzylalcohol acetyltransferase-like [Capsicum annuum]|nr:putative acetyl-CoA-benzylalcohol acetyltransferase-like [Capsicum annuum]